MYDGINFVHFINLHHTGGQISHLQYQVLWEVIAVGTFG